MQRAQAMFRESISLDDFACPQSKVTSRFQELHSRGLDRGWNLAQLEQRSRLVEPAVVFVDRRSLQAPCGASSSGASRPGVVIPNVVTVPARTRGVPCQSATTKVQCLSFTQGENGAISQHGRASKSSFLSSWRQTMTSRAFRDCTLGPLQWHVERLLWAGRRESTKVSFSGKWMWFVNFCTLALPSEYGMQPRRSLPASMSTVLLHLSHLSQKGEVREGSLNPYLAVINQMYQDSGYRRPALGHYADLLRKGFANVEVQDTSSAPVRMTLPPTVVHDADTGVLLRRSHVSFDRRGIAINSQGKTIVKNRSYPVFRRHSPDFDPEDKVCRLLRRWHDTSAS
jgi:hypothetical protein